MLMQLLPLLFVMLSMFLPTLLSTGSNQSALNRGSGLYGNQWEGQYFSLDKNRIFSREEETSLGTKYFLRNERRYNNAFYYDPTKNKVALEEQVEASYLTKLIKQCDDENILFEKNYETIKSDANISNKKRISKLKSLKKSFSINNKLHENINMHNYHIGNGNGKMCNRLDDYLDNLS